jgi:hypothetical protein
MDDTVIQSSRGKILLYLVVSLVFSLGSLAMVQSDHSDGAWKLWLGGIFFGFGSLVFVALLIRPQRLVLDRTGFALEGGLVLSPKKVAWSDVDEFFVWRLPRGGKSVGYRYRPGAKNVPKIVKVNRAFGADGALPRAWPLGPDELAAELNAYRESALRQSLRL